jgi:hypothetical protein
VIVTTGLHFLFTFISGGWLAANSGKPVDTIAVTAHKLLSLLTLLVTAMAIYLLIQGHIQ